MQKNGTRDSCDVSNHWKELMLTKENNKENSDNVSNNNNKDHLCYFIEIQREFMCNVRIAQINNRNAMKV